MKVILKLFSLKITDLFPQIYKMHSVFLEMKVILLRCTFDFSQTHGMLSSVSENWGSFSEINVILSSLCYFVTLDMLLSSHLQKMLSWELRIPSWNIMVNFLELMHYFSVYLQIQDSSLKNIYQSFKKLRILFWKLGLHFLRLTILFTVILEIEVTFLNLTGYVPKT